MGKSLTDEEWREKKTPLIYCKIVYHYDSGTETHWIMRNAED